MNSTHHLEDSKEDQLPGLVKVSVPPPHPRNRSRMRGKARVHLGAPVRLKSSDCIHAKLRHYASTVAKITALPVHPNTWFGLKLYDGTEIKVRRSAFEYLDESDPQYDGVEELPPDQMEDSPRFSYVMTTKHKTKKQKKNLESRTSKRRSSQQLKSSNPIGQYVMITNGRYSGRRGYVSKGSNGYFSVQMLEKAFKADAGSTVMKRSCDLQVIDRPDDLNLAQIGSDDDYRDESESDDNFSELSNTTDDEDLLQDSEDEFSFPSARFPSTRTFPASRFRPFNDNPMDKRRRINPHNGISLIEKRVILTQGKNRGEIGTVKRSGHGFYAVHVHERGVELMKRASELKLCDVQEITIPVKSGEDLHSAAQILMNMVNGNFQEGYGLGEDHNELQVAGAPLSAINEPEQEMYFADYPPYLTAHHSSPTYTAPALKKSFSSSFSVPHHSSLQTCSVHSSSSTASSPSVSSSSLCNSHTPCNHNQSLSNSSASQLHDSIPLSLTTPD